MSTATEWHPSKSHFNDGIVAKLLFKDDTYAKFSNGGVAEKIRRGGGGFGAARERIGGQPQAISPVHPHVMDGQKACCG